MGHILIRAPRPSDAAVMARIWTGTCAYYAEMDAAVYQVPGQEGLVEWFERLLSAPSSAEDEVTFVAELDGQVAGWVEAELQAPADDADKQMLRDLGRARVIVNNLAVDHSRWHAGIGTALMNAAEEWGKERGAEVAGLDTYVESPVSVPFYEKRMGYSRYSIMFRKHL